MTIPAFSGLESSLRGLLAAQAAIDTTAHNIDNASTPGYSRQTVDLTASAPLTIAGGSTGQLFLGTGVDMTAITRIRNQFLDVQYRAQNTATNNASTEQSVLNQVQAGLDEPSNSGISSALQAFWSSWNALANQPTSAAARQNVVDSGATLAQTFQSISQQLTSVQGQAAQQYAALTASPSGQVQSDANQIASLNQEISQQQAAGGTPNDLLDQRDNLIDDLSSLASVTVTNLPNGMVKIGLGNAAAPVVNGATVNWPQTLTAGAGGTLGALLNLSGPGGQIAGYLSSLNAVANQLVTNVNALHTSTPFFSGNSASTIGVALTPSQVQTSSTNNPGANDVALAVAGLSGGAADQSYQAFIGQVGGQVQAAQRAQQTAQSLLTAIGNQRQSVSGVSLDEEMTNLITYQRSYQASARVMTTIDSTLDQLINHTGTVGL